LVSVPFNIQIEIATSNPAARHSLMYSIDRKSNAILKIQEKSFSELGFREKEHLQEWISKNPECLGEDLLVIQKEFNGFNDTYERLDLLALDKQGNLVIIENKLDDSGRDVTWQAQKYASYCSTLKKDQIRKIYQELLDKEGSGENAEDNLLEFFGASDLAEISINSGQAQRIILIAANFRKEVTSTVLWLLNYKLRIQCFKVTPFENNGSLLLNIEQIIPMKDSEEYVISMADKAQEDISTQEELKSRHFFRIEFWKTFLKIMNIQSSLYQNVNASKDYWISGRTGISSINFNSSVSNYYARAEVYMQRSVRDENKFVFDELFREKEEIEREFGEPLVWERLETKKACRIKYELSGVDFYDRDDWNRMVEFLVDGMVRMERAFKDPLAKVRLKLKNMDS